MSQTTWYKPRSCFWLRVILSSRTCCWTPPPVTDIIWRYQRGVAWPQEPNIVLLWSGTKASISFSGVPEDVPPAIGRGGTINENTTVFVFHGSSWIGGLLHPWFHTGVIKVDGQPLLCQESTFLSIFRVILIEMLVWFNMRINSVMYHNFFIL